MTPYEQQVEAVLDLALAAEAQAIVLRKRTSDLLIATWRLEDLTRRLKEAADRL